MFNLMWLPALSQRHGGGTRRPAATPVELDRANAGKPNQEQDQDLLLCARRNSRETVRALQHDLKQAVRNCQKQNQRGWHESLTASSTAYDPAQHHAAWLAPPPPKSVEYQHETLCSFNTTNDHCRLSRRSLMPWSRSGRRVPHPLFFRSMGA